MTHHRLLLCLVAVSFAATSRGDIIILPPPSGFNALEVLGVSADGSTVVGTVSANSGASQAFRWTRPGGIQLLGSFPGLSSSTAGAVSADGSVVVGTSGTGYSSQVAFRWTQAGGMQSLGTLPGDVGSFATAVSANGGVVVGNSNVSGAFPRAFRWTQSGGMVAIGSPANSNEAFRASGVSADGSVLAGHTGPGYSAYRWTQQTGFTDIAPSPAFQSSSAFGISPDGQTIVGMTTPSPYVRSQAYAWTQAGGTATLNPVTGWAYTTARAASALGSVIVGDGSSPNLGHEAFIWDDAHGLLLLRTVLAQQGDSVQTWQLLSATGISADGQTVVGNAFNSVTGGESVGYIAVVTGVPEPSCLALAGLPAAGVLAAWRRRRGSVTEAA